MKIMIPTCRWVGGTLKFVSEAFEKMGHDVRFCAVPTEKEISPLTHYLKIRQIKRVQTLINRKVEEVYNKRLLETVEEYRPDVYFSLSCLSVFPETLKQIKEDYGVCTVSWVADNPFDTSRFVYYPCNLQYYEYLFLGDRIWEQNIRNIAPKSKLFHLVGAYSPEDFKPVELSPEEQEQLGCNIAFAGTAYGHKAEGKYRAGVLAQIADLGLKVWGDQGWEKLYRCFPGLTGSYQGKRLEFGQLNKMYQAAKINLNIPNPQCYQSFQQRTFEIAAAKGFQIVDYRSDIDLFFNEDEIVTFKTIDELREKIVYYLERPEERAAYIEKAHKKVVGIHTYENRMKEVLEKIGKGNR